MAVIEIATRGTTVSVDNGLLRIGRHRLHPDEVDMVIAALPAVTITGDAMALLGRLGIGLGCATNADSVKAVVMSNRATEARSRYRRTVDRDTPLAKDMADWLSPSSRRSRKISLIRRISDSASSFPPKRA